MTDITIKFPDEIAEKIFFLEDRDEFVVRAVAEALRRISEAPADAAAPSEPSEPVPVEAGLPGSLARMRAGEVNVLGPFETPGLAPRCIRVYLPRDYTPER
ncbi:MAG: hypothetical protein ACLGI9_25530, partial [Thermoanaerobaculia bacterium]